jgi:hypothetical protein
MLRMVSLSSTLRHRSLKVMSDDGPKSSGEVGNRSAARYNAWRNGRRIADCTSLFKGN